MRRHQLIEIIRNADYNIFCVSIIKSILRKGDYMEYISVREVSMKWNISRRRIQILCSEGRINGVARIGNMWVIPKEAEKPRDARIKSGKYVKAISKS